LGSGSTQTTQIKYKRTKHCSHLGQLRMRANSYFESSEERMPDRCIVNVCAQSAFSGASGIYNKGVQILTWTPLTAVIIRSFLVCVQLRCGRGELRCNGGAQVGQKRHADSGHNGQEDRVFRERRTAFVAAEALKAREDFHVFPVRQESRTVRESGKMIGKRKFTSDHASCARRRADIQQTRCKLRIGLRFTNWIWRIWALTRRRLS